MERTAEYYLTKGIDNTVNTIIVLLLVCTMLYSGYALWDTWSVINSPVAVQRQLVQYKPSGADDLSASFEELLAINSDVCAWITIDNTKIDYPVLQGKTNFDYLSTDVYGEYAASGSIFLDCDNNRNFTDCYSILMGHHMQGGAMFGDIDLFTSKQFFQENITGALYLPDRELMLETVAIIQADAYDRVIYDVSKNTDIQMESLISQIESLALYMRGEPLSTEEQLIALSTCSSDYTNARLLLICRVTEEKLLEEGSEN